MRWWPGMVPTEVDRLTGTQIFELADVTDTMIEAERKHDAEMRAARNGG